MIYDELFSHWLFWLKNWRFSTDICNRFIASFIKTVAIWWFQKKLATLDLLKLKVFCNKAYDVIIPAFEVTNKTLSRDSNYIVYAVVWPKFGNSGIYIWEIIITSIL